MLQKLNESAAPALIPDIEIVTKDDGAFQYRPIVRRDDVVVWRAPPDPLSLWYSAELALRVAMSVCAQMEASSLQ